MNKKNKIGLILISSLTATLFLFPISIAHGSVETAVTYLIGQAENPWVTMALSAVGEKPNIDYLKSVDGSSAIELAAPVLAITAAGEDPRTFPDNDLVAELKEYYTDGQIGDTSILNDDIFGLLALLSAGEPTDDVVVSGTKDFILQNQNEDGGWGFSANGGSDTNMTSATIMALIESGMSTGNSVIQNATAYLESAQNADGGFPYDPQGAWGTDSDASSDAWVVSAIESVNGDINDWVIEGVGGPIEHLLSLQTEGGYFQYQTGTGEDNFTSVTTSYAVIALAGKSYPVNSILYDPPEPDNEEGHGGGSSGSSKKPVDGGWSDWNRCHVECGGGIQTRTCTDPKPAYGGDNCEGISTQACNTQACGTVAGVNTTKPISEMTIEELKAELSRLMTLLAQLQGEQVAGAVCTTPFNTDLFYGLMDSPEVKRLQEYLISKNYLAVGYNTGNYLILTANAVKTLQTAKTIVPVSGYFGPLTRAAVNAGCAL